MFTGIITDVGTLQKVTPSEKGRRLRIATAYDPETIDIGASIACAGVCLTVVDRGSEGGASWFDVEAWEEALRLTTIGDWMVGTRLNLERALRVGDEIGGHQVSGHIDATAEIVDMVPEGEATRFFLRAPDDLARYIVPKGSVALDGTSLTVNGVSEAVFDVLLIRHSLEVTTWEDRQIGHWVNLEVDPLARHVERAVARLAQFGKQA